MPYAVPTDLATFFDVTVIADLASDDGTPSADYTTDANVLAALSAASGQVNAAVMVGNIYVAADLAALVGDDLQLLKEIVCQLAMAKLIRRRPEKYGSEAYQKYVEDAESYLDRLRKGERLFNLPAQEAAGLPEVDGPTIVTVNRLNLITARTRNFYIDPGRRLPLGRA